MNISSLSRWKRIILFALATPLVLLLVLFGILQTPQFKGFIVRTVNNLDLGELDIRIGNLSGLIPFQLTLDRFTCSDAQGQFLDLKDLELKIIPWSLSRGGAGIDVLAVQRLRLDRAPQLPADQAPAPHEEKTPSIPNFSLPVSVFVNALKIRSLSLGADLAGQEVELAVSAHAEVRSSDQWNMALDVEQLDPMGLKAHLAAAMHEGPAGLDLDMRFVDHPQGLVLRRLGLDIAEPLLLSLRGSGPISDWKATLNAHMANTQLVSASFGMQTGPDEIMLSAQSKLFPLPLLPQKLRSLLPGIERIDADLAATANPELNSFQLQKGFLQSKLVSIRLQGAADIRDKNIDAVGSIHLPNLKLLQPLLNMPLSGAARLDCIASGTMSRPELDVSTELSDLQVQNIQVQEANLSLEPRLQRSTQGHLEQIILCGEFNADTVHHGNNPILPGPLKTTFQGTFSPSTQDVDVQSLRLNLPGMEAMLSGQAQGSGQFQAHMRTDIEDVHDFPQLKGLAVHSGLIFQGQAAGNWQQSTAEGSLEITLDDLQGFPQPVSKILGLKPQILADIRFLDGERLRLDSLQISGREIDFQAQAQIGLSDQDLAAEWILQGPDLTTLDFADLSGLFSATGQLNGTFQQLRTNIDIQVADLAGYQIRPSRFSGQISADLNTASSGVDGKFLFDLHRGKERITLSSNFAFAEQIFRFPDLGIQGPKTDISAHVALNTQQQHIDSELQMAVAQVQALQSFFQIPVQGGLRLFAAVHGPMSQPHISARGQVHNLQAAGTKIQALDLQAELKNIPTLDGNIALQGKDIVFGSQRIHEFTVTAEGGQNQATATMNLTGDLGGALALSTQVGMKMNKDQIKISLPQGDGHFEALPFSWNQPLQVDLTGNNLHLSWPEMRLGKGVLQIEANAENEQVQGSVQAQNLDLAQFPVPADFGLSGKTGMDISLSGTRTSPEIAFDLRIQDLRSRVGQAEDRPGISIQANGNVTSGELKSQLVFQGESDLDLQASLNLPVDFVLQPVTFQAGNRLTADLQGHADLGLMSTFMPLDGQDLEGRLAMDIHTSGSLPQPLIQGNIGLSDGQFENFSTGTLLTDVQAAIALRGYQATLKQLTATDGEQGMIQVSGNVDFDPDSGLSYSLETQLDKATLVRMDMATAGISGGLDLEGNTQGADIYGDLKAFPVNIGLPDPAPSGLQGLHIVRDQQEQTGEDTDFRENDSSFAKKTTLDIKVLIPGGCYVRGRGLDSEWEGNLHIQGQADQPKISGYVQVMRGHLDLLTKRFILDKGKVTFLSRYPPQPEIDIVAETSVNDLLAKVNISGQATEPSIELSSEPVLPRDEILARILFNRPLSQISPVQAVKLALAVRTLTSGGGGGIMSKVRQSMGLDELSIDTDPNASSGVTVGAGKYLNEDIYFKVEKGLEEDSGQVMVNVQMTPRISLESRAGSEQQGLYITWSYSY